MIQKYNQVLVIFALSAAALTLNLRPASAADSIAEPAKPAPAEAPAAASPPAILPNPDASLVDDKISPCEDYFQYACGGWLKSTEIPTDRPSWGRGFGSLDERNQELLRDVLERYSNGKFEPANPYAQKLGDFYGSCMDKGKLELGSMKTLENEMKILDRVTLESLPEWIAHMRLNGVRVLFLISQTQDNKNPEAVIAEINQAGMGLPTKEYYVSQSEQMKDVRAKYTRYITRLFTLAGEDDKQAATDADLVLKFETKLAQNALMPAEMRDPKKTYHPVEVSKLPELAPDLAWPNLFKTLSLETVKTVNVSEPDFIKGMNDALKTTPFKELKPYLMFSLLNGASKGLPDRFYNETFNFYGKMLSGFKEMPVRWKLCVQAANEMMGFAVGRSYVALTFAGDSKAIAREMIEHIEKTEGDVIKTLPWMDAPTKKSAKQKLANLVNHIGFPDVWRTYDALPVDRTSYLANRFAATNFNARYELDKIGKPLNRNDWGMVPSAVNAYYEPQMDKMVFPAGILQPPFFNANYTSAANYGGIGMVMGHEMSHGFDDQGRQFDAKGAMQDWWSTSSAKEFDKRAQCLEHQYDAYPVAGGGHVNGKLTLGEDIGDQGGIKLAYLSWKSSLKKDVLKDPAKFKEGEKQFFLSFAQTWCAKDTEAYEKLKATMDPHPPARYRVNGPLSNLPAFGEAYECKAGSQLAPKNRCIVW